MSAPPPAVLGWSVVDPARGARLTGAPPAVALAAATTVPARLLGRPDLGTLREGAAADVAPFTTDLRVVATVAAGVVAHRRDGARPLRPQPTASLMAVG